MFNLFPDPDHNEVEHNFGLFDNDGKTMKPAGHAMANLIGLLADPGPAFQPGRLDFVVSGDNVQTILLQKRDGEFWLALWLSSSLWDHSRPYGQKQEEDPADQSCVLTFAKPQDSITVYGDLDRENPSVRELPDGKQLDLTVSENVQLVRFGQPRP